MNPDKYTQAARLNVVGLARSGQHGIVNWLFQQFNAALFLNNYQNSRAYDPVWFKRGRNLGVFRGEFFTPLVVGYGLEGSVNRMKENCHPSVIVFRDVLNHMASLKSHKHTNMDDRVFLNEWMKYYEVVCDENIENMVVINFPLWHSSIEYRRRCAANIFKMIGLDGMTYTDVGKESVMESGGGSSFDGTEYNGNASKMDVLNRYKSVKLPEISDHILQANHSVFGAYV